MLKLDLSKTRLSNTRWEGWGLGEFKRVMRTKYAVEGLQNFEYSPTSQAPLPYDTESE